MSLLLDHLWQSTLIAALVALLAFSVRRKGAAVRFWLWFAASLKFLLPFALLTASGRWLSTLWTLPIALPDMSLPGVRPAAEMMLVPAQNLLAAPGPAVPAGAPWLGVLHWGLTAVWLGGAALLTAVRVVRWRRLCRIMRGSHAADIGPGPVKVRIAASPMEPGLVGLLRPVVLLPAGLPERMTADELNAILGHELAHHYRRDNLTAAVHMLVETLFWFWPVVWLVGARMIAERERACDECVVAAGHDPHVYASGILKICRFHVGAPLTCVSGASATGLSAAGLAGRIARITAEEAPEALGRAKGAILMALAGLLLMAPLLAAMVPDEIRREVHRQVAIVQHKIDQRINRQIGHDLQPQFVGTPGEAIRVAGLPATPQAAHPAVQAAAAATVGPAVPPLPSSVHAAVSGERAQAPGHQQFTAPAPAESQAERLSAAIAHAHMALYPNGKGDPDAVTCRVPQYLPASRFKGPTICKVNRIWATLRARELEFTPDGALLVSTNTMGPRTVIAVNKAG
jgi:beta-lactamase regulating signal transducer with metallopeptidase domain